MLNLNNDLKKCPHIASGICHYYYVNCKGQIEFKRCDDIPILEECKKFKKNDDLKHNVPV